MNARWQNVVLLAHEVERACSQEQAPDVTHVARLARAVLNLQQYLVGEGPPRPQLPPGRRGVETRAG